MNDSGVVTSRPQKTLSSETGQRPGWLASRPTRHAIIIFIISMAGLLLEVSYTRIVSFKLWYYYVYMVLGLALLGIGSGGVLVAVSKRIKAASIDAILTICGFAAAVIVAVSYFVTALVDIDTVKFWDYLSSGSIWNLFLLSLISLFLFASFLPFGVAISVLLGRGDNVGKLYFSDLVGASLGCLLAIPLISKLTPPSVVFLAALLFAISGFIASEGIGSLLGKANALVAALLVVPVFVGCVLPDVVVEAAKLRKGVKNSAFHDWGPVFRVDVVGVYGKPEDRLLAHDGTFGSGIHRFDGDTSVLSRYDKDPRSLPFAALGHPSERTLIIGSAGGNEILTSLYYKTKTVDAVELNPVTVGILKNQYNEFTGDLPNQPGVNVYNADARSFVARADDKYDLAWFVAPDSYAANNAVSSGAFVLSESYLYTSDMLKKVLDHLTDDGLMVVQFGELNYENYPMRTTRLISTARAALVDKGIKDPSLHIMFSAFLSKKGGDQVTIMIKKSPFTSEEIQRVGAQVKNVDFTKLEYAPNSVQEPGPAPSVAGAKSQAEAHEIVDGLPFAADEVTDDKPFFWHFFGFQKVIKELPKSVDRVDLDPSAALGERVLLLLLGFAVVYAAVFLLLPFALVRKRWSALPAKGTSGLYFACLGLGFILLEISLIQKLTLLLGYPTYSLTVTLASLLFATGVGALLSERVAAKAGERIMKIVFGALVLVVLLYQLGLGPITDALLSSPLLVRFFATFVMLLPLGFCLGMFMPMGLRRVSTLVDDASDYVAWSWAVNGFFSVIGSTATTILSMVIGFRNVMWVALLLYLVAAFTYAALGKVDRQAAR